LPVVEKSPLYYSHSPVRITSGNICLSNFPCEAKVAHLEDGEMGMVVAGRAEVGFSNEN
jgi:hypothetical protein